MISVIITTYNRYASLKLAVEKIKQQTYKDIEIIVSNDCSSDNTEDIKTDFPDIVYCKTPENLGYMLNSLYALNKASGEYVIFLSDDDLLIDDTFFEKAMERSDGCDAYFGRCRTVSGKDINYIEYPFKEKYTGKEFIEELISLKFSFLDYFSLSSFIFNTQLLRAVKPFDSVFANTNSTDIATIVKFALTCANIGFIDVPSYEWKKSDSTSISGVKKDDLTYQTIQSVSAAIDIYNFFDDKSICKDACNAYIEYIFDAILSDHRQIDITKHMEKLLSDIPSKEFYIYGMGWAGRELSAFAAERGFNILGFIDDFKAVDNSAMSCDSFAALGGEKHVVIANYKYKAVYQIYKKLSSLSNVHIYDMVSCI